MLKIKLFTFGAITVAMTAATLAPCADAAKFLVNNAEVAGAREFNSNRLPYGMRLESYIEPAKNPYTFACYGIRLNGKFKAAGESENKLTSNNCRMSKYNAAHQEEPVPGCTVNAPITLSFKGSLLAAVGNDKLEGEEAMMRAGKFKVEGGMCAAELVGNYTVKGAPICSLFGAEFERQEHWLFCVPAGLEKEGTYTLTKEGGATYPLRMLLNPALGVFRGNEPFPPPWSVM